MPDLGHQIAVPRSAVRGGRTAARIALGLLLAMETALAAWMSELVWAVTSSPFLFPSPVRSVVSLGGTLAGGVLTAYCALLSLSAFAGHTTGQRRLGAKVRLVHLPVAFVACLVWLWVFGFDGGFIETFGWPLGLMALALAWSQFVLWAFARVVGRD